MERVHVRIMPLQGHFSFHSGGILKFSRIMLVLLAANLPLLGGTVTVTDLGDTGAIGQLRWAIAQANNGDSIAFSVSGTISPVSALNIATNLTIDGGGGITIDGSGYSGAIFSLTGSATDTFSNLTLRNATDAISGSSNNVLVQSATISGNGTGLDNLNATVVNTTFGNNGTAINGGTLSLSGSTILNSSSGGLVNVSGSVTNSTLAFDTTAVSGGTLTLSGSTISGNLTGGLVNANATVTNSSFANNTVAINGGTVGLYDSTISGGTTGIENSTLTIGNTIVYGDTTDAGAGNVLTDLGHNLIGNGSGFSNGTNGDMVGTNPNLGSIANNGGPTLTYGLSAGSPAIDAGDNSLIPSGITTDQRGPSFSRISGSAVDIGAFEFQQPTPEPATYGICLLALALGARRARTVSRRRTPAA